MTLSRLVILFLGLLLGLTLIKQPQQEEGQPGKKDQASIIPPAKEDADWKGGYITEMQFPTDRKKKETSWKIHWYVKRKGEKENFVIREAWFKPNLKKDWVKILGPTYMAEIHVAYISGLRYYDMTQQTFELSQATDEETGPRGRILDADKKIVGELRTRGILWKHEDQARRGESLLLWGTLQAGNYDYLMEYGFQDDGILTFRMGSTGQNLPDRPWEAHTHNGFWRVDIDLGGSTPNDVYITKHVETREMRGQGKDFVNPLNNGFEGFADWEPHGFSKLLITNPKIKNANQHFLSYLLVPVRPGTARHFGGKGNTPFESFTHHDFWVTAHHDGEEDYTQVEKYIANREKIKGGNVVLWHMASGYHIPRDEDFVDGKPAVALTMWCGFDLRPRNLFDRTPFYP